MNYRDLAEELTQNLFEDLWKRRASLAINNLDAYLFGSLKFAIINYYKSQIVQEKYELHLRKTTQENASTDHLILLHDPADALNKGIELLPKKTAEVFKRSRLRISAYPAGDFAGKGKDYALSAIYYERKLELAMEGHRFFDLVRWGTADTELNAYFSYEGKITTDVTRGKFIKGKNDYYPIPQRQIDLSQAGSGPVLKQNPGY